MSHCNTSHHSCLHFVLHAQIGERHRINKLAMHLMCGYINHSTESRMVGKETMQGHRFFRPPMWNLPGSTPSSHTFPQSLQLTALSNATSKQQLQKLLHTNGNMSTFGGVCHCNGMTLWIVMASLYGNVLCGSYTDWSMKETQGHGHLITPIWHCNALSTYCQ